MGPCVRAPHLCIETARQSALASVCQGHRVLNGMSQRAIDVAKDDSRL
jgi:hypothetical protein